MPPDLANQFNPLACKADFTYSMTAVTVKIQDSGKGKKSVADDLEAVLRRVLAPGSDRLLPHQLPGHPRGRALGRVGRANGASARS
jgi:hypothetical protein